MKRGLVLVGTIAGMLLPGVARDLATVTRINADASLGYHAIQIMLYGAYGALAGWAIGGLWAHLIGER